MTKTKTTPSTEKISRDEYYFRQMQEWKEPIATQKGFDNFPLPNIRINPNLVDRDFFEKGAVKWIRIYYKNNYPIFNDLDIAYIGTNRWLEQFTPSKISRMNRIQTFEILCCRVWTLLIAEEYGQM